VTTPTWNTPSIDTHSRAALTGDRAIAWSGGSEPGHEVNLAAATAMAERGIDISNEFPKPWTDETVRNATNPGTATTTPPVSTPDLTFTAHRPRISQEG
jgi:hypothetical protein